MTLPLRERFAANWFSKSTTYEVPYFDDLHYRVRHYCLLNDGSFFGALHNLHTTERIAQELQACAPPAHSSLGTLSLLDRIASFASKELSQYFLLPASAIPLPVEWLVSAPASVSAPPKLSVRVRLTGYQEGECPQLRVYSSGQVQRFDAFNVLLAPFDTIETDESFRIFVTAPENIKAYLDERDPFKLTVEGDHVKPYGSSSSSDSSGLIVQNRRYGHFIQTFKISRMYDPITQPLSKLAKYHADKGCWEFCFPRTKVLNVTDLISNSKLVKEASLGKE